MSAALPSLYGCSTRSLVGSHSQVSRTDVRPHIHVTEQARRRDGRQEEVQDTMSLAIRLPSGSRG